MSIYWRNSLYMIFILKVLFWIALIFKRLKLQMPDWSQMKAYEIFFDLRPIWHLSLKRFRNETNLKKNFRDKKRLLLIQLWIFILLHPDVMAKLFYSDQWNFHTNNQSSSALWIFFQNYFCILRRRMTSFSYI